MPFVDGMREANDCSGDKENVPLRTVAQENGPRVYWLHSTKVLSAASPGWRPAPHHRTLDTGSYASLHYAVWPEPRY